MTRVCEFCGGKLPPDHTRFCSGKCLAKFRETKRIAKVCLVCGQRFYVTPWEAGRRFCSIRCSGLAKRKGETITCEYCGQAFYATRDALAKGVRFCSRLCRNQASRRGGSQVGTLSSPTS